MCCSVLAAITPEQKALLFFQQYGGAFGISETADITRTLNLTNKQTDDKTGNVHLTYSQRVEAIPVFGAGLTVHFDKAVQIQSVSGIYVKDATQVDDTPTISRANATERAKRFIFKTHYDDLNATYHVAQVVFGAANRSTGADSAPRAAGYVLPTVIRFGGAATPVSPLTSTSKGNPTPTQLIDLLNVTAPVKLVIFKDGLLEGREGDSVLTWAVQVESQRLKMMVYVHAHTGVIVESYSLVPLALQRSVSIYPNLPQWSEGQAFPTGNRDVDNIVTVAGHTYNWIGSMSGGSWLSINGRSIPMTSVIDLRSAVVSCPNAMFDGVAATFCSGVTADDVVSHEFAHGLTQYTSGLIYKYQQGGMNEGNKQPRRLYIQSDTLRAGCIRCQTLISLRSVVLCCVVLCVAVVSIFRHLW